ncbi:MULTISPECIES: hypothetical protein [Brevibacterium]|jgi:hypothetical protein|uniref:Uncharacterized protein n=1 Tax=Brevibacterium casei TaxID=33889 RepID=A0A7T4DJN4_9MICO|nr:MULTISPECIES: hypothetical protein [Brevibacterium]QQB14104.1 hypothetical protein I6H47_15225 [Brevibacterium casei]
MSSTPDEHDNERSAHGFDRDPGSRRTSALAAHLDSGLERVSGISDMPEADERERDVIFRSLAIGFTVFRWTSVAIALLFLASGLWWATVVVLASADLPFWVARFHARRRGVNLYRQSGLARREWTTRSTLMMLGVFAVMLGLIAFQSTVGHPLLPWSWSVGAPTELESSAPPIVGAAVGLIIGWSLRRKRSRAALK